MTDWFVLVAIKSFLAIMAVSTSSVVSAVRTDPSRLLARQLEQFHVKTASSSVKVTFTGFLSGKKSFYQDMMMMREKGAGTVIEGERCERCMRCEM